MELELHVKLYLHEFKFQNSGISLIILQIVIDYYIFFGQLWYLATLND